MDSKLQNPGLNELVNRRYQHGFVTDIESDTVSPGLSEDVIRFISHKKEEPGFLLEWRLKAYRYWLTMREPAWARLHYPPIDYQDISYFSAPKKTPGLKSLDEVDPKLLATYEKLGVPLHDRARLAGVAVDAVFDSVSVTTTFRDKLAAAGVIDPTKVTRVALENAVSIASMLLTTECVIVEKPKEEKAMPAMPPGGGMDY